MPHRLRIDLAVFVKAAYERKCAVVGLLAAEYFLPRADVIVERTAADVAVGSGERLTRAWLLAETRRRYRDEPVVGVCVQLVEIHLAGSAAVLRPCVRCAEAQLRPRVGIGDDLFRPAEVPLHLLLVFLQDIVNVGEALLCLVFGRRENIGVVLAYAVSIGQQAEVLEAEIAVLARSASDIDREHGETQTAVGAVGAVVEREAELLPREKPEREVFLVAEIFRKLFFIDVYIFLGENILDHVAEHELFAADLVFSASHKSDIVVNDLAADSARSSRHSLSASSATTVSPVIHRRASMPCIALLVSRSSLIEGLGLPVEGITAPFSSMSAFSSPHTFAKAI